jgi:gluconate 2-dehydrogenase gamma chain
MKVSLSRRRFLQVAGALGLTQALGVELQGQQAAPPLPQAPEYQAATRPRGLRQLQGVYTYLTVPEARFVEAAVSRLIPDDDLGPSALWAGVPYFIDQQLQSKYGLAAKWYMQGPWGDGTEEQGYQLPLTPQELFRLCIPALDMVAEEEYGATFADLSSTDQDSILLALEAGELQIEGLPKRILDTFWDSLYDLTMFGYFADSAYGGNRDKVGWKLVGFPGVAAAYRGVLENYYGLPYRVDPVSIGDIQVGLVGTDDHGHAVHHDIATGEAIAGAEHEREH